MELARTFKILWKRRVLVALGAAVAAILAFLSIYTVSLFPPSATSRTNVFATASTQILIDTPNSAFADISDELLPLETRASVFARFLASPVAVGMIAEEAGVPANSIEAQGPYDLNLPVIQQEPTAEKRSTQIIGEGDLYRLRFDNNPVLPIVAVFSQAPTKEEAINLANAVPKALNRYVTELQEQQHTPASKRVVVRKLGEATGGVVNEGANIQIAGLVFFVVFGFVILLLVPGQTVARGWRKAGEEGPDGNGRGPVGEPKRYAPGNGNGIGSATADRGRGR
jgi:hypothetical protein